MESLYSSQYKIACFFNYIGSRDTKIVQEKYKIVQENCKKSTKLYKKITRKVQNCTQKLKKFRIKKIIYIVGSDLPHCHHIASKLVACVWYISYPSLAAYK